MKCANFWFNEIMKLPDDIRNDTKERTGISVYIRQPGTNKRNSIHFSVRQPSQDAQDFAVEKAVRFYVLGHFSSQNSADERKLHFPGSLTLEIEGELIQVSV